MFRQEPGEEIDFELRLTPLYETPKIPDAPEYGIRTYAGCRIDSISTLGLMTLHMNETVVTHESYANLSQRDFDVVFEMNSEEEN